MENAEAFVNPAVQGLRLAVEVMGAVLIGVGFIVASGQFLRGAFKGDTTNFVAIRLVFARYLALALEFQLGADILSTAIAPGWQEIGRLGAIAVIRTGLNYFLSLEMKEQQAIRTDEETINQEVSRS